MPTIRLTVPKDDLTREEKAAFVEHITDAVSEFYRDTKDEQVRDVVNVRIAETAEHGYAIGGEIIG